MKPLKKQSFVGRRPRGIVMIITLLSIVLIAALLAYVMNLGGHTNARIVIQNSADATAIGGAGWVARSFNTVAMNNVAMAKYLSLVNFLDAIPLTVQLTIKDDDSFQKALRDQIDSANGRDGFIDEWVENLLLKALPPSPVTGISALPQGLIKEYVKEMGHIRAIDQLLNKSGYDIQAMTAYSGPAGKGKIWSALTTLDEYNRATIENVSVLAQVSADRGGDANIGEVDANSFMVPILPPAIPLRESTFEDFRRPVNVGLLPEGVDNKQTNRGPFDTIFGWRYPSTLTTARYEPGDPSIAGPGHGNLPVSGGVSLSHGQWITPPTSYVVHGPKGWMYEKMAGFAGDAMPWYISDRFFRYLEGVVEPKFTYMFDGGPIREVRDPKWITNFEEAKAIHQNNPSEIAESCFLYIGIKSRNPMGGSGFMAPGTYALATCNVETIQGFADPGGASMINKWVWRDTWDYLVNYDNELGLTEKFTTETQTTPDGSKTIQVPIPQTVYRIDEFIFLGSNVGTFIPVRNPSNFSSRADLPAPTDFDHTKFCSCNDKRADYLTYLGVSTRKFEVPIMGNLFKSDEVSPNMVGVAQAKVFNDHSWDLWTQMWHAQLEPVTNVPHWNTLMTQGLTDCGNVPTVSSINFQEARDYLRKLEPLAEPMLTH